MSEEKPVDIGNENVRRLRAMLYRLSTSEGTAYGEVEREIIAYVGTLATPASPASATELNAARWLFTMEHQDAQVHPQAFLDMFRKVREDGRTTPTRAEYEAATDAAMIETGFMPASAQPVSDDQRFSVAQQFLEWNRAQNEPLVQVGREYSVAFEVLKYLSAPTAPEPVSQEEEILSLHRQLAHEKLRADQGWERYESANRDRNDLRAAMVEPVSGMCIPGVIPAPKDAHQLWTRWSERRVILATPDEMAKDLADCETQAKLELEQCGKPGWWAGKVKKIKEGIATYEARAAAARPEFANEPVSQPVVAVPEDYRLIAHLIGTIYFAGDFVAETANERLLESLLVKTGHRYRAWPEVTAAADSFATPLAAPVEQDNHTISSATGLDQATIDKHLDAVLRASGSALKYFSMQKTIDGMRSAMRAALNGEAAS